VFLIHNSFLVSNVQAEKGYTFDSEHNDVIEHFERMRYDRILASCNGPFRPTDIQLVGDQPLGVPLHQDEESFRLSHPPPRPTRPAAKPLTKKAKMSGSDDDDDNEDTKFAPMPSPKPSSSSSSTSSPPSSSSPSSLTLSPVQVKLNLSTTVPDGDGDDDEKQPSTPVRAHRISDSDDGQDDEALQTPPKREKMLYPSDHFGLLASFDLIAA
jgi:hypothetical protein